MVPRRPATVIFTPTPAPTAAGAAQLSVVADIHWVVLQLMVPNRADGVRLVLAKLRPVIVTEPEPHVGVLRLMKKLDVGASNVKRFRPQPTRPATVAQLMPAPTVGVAVLMSPQLTVVLLDQEVVAHCACSMDAVGVKDAE